MKRKDIKNDKVLRAITIGLATMIAATSAPLNVYAAEDQQSGDDVEAGGGEQNNGGGEQQATPIDVSEVTAADAALPVAAELVSTPVQADGVMTADAVAAPGGLIPVAETAVEGLLVLPAEGQTAEQTPQLPGVENALKQLETAAGSVQEVKEDLAGFEAALAADGQAEAAPIEAGFPGLSVEDGGITDKDIQVLNTSEPEEYYEDKTPVGGENVDHYDESVNGNEFHSATEDEKPFVKSIVDDYTEAYDNFQNFLSDNSDESKIKAFDAAARADEKLTKQENKIKELDEAIKDSAAAEQALKKAKEDLETVKTIKTKYDAVMTQYFKEMITNFDQNVQEKGLLNGDGSINADNCIALLKEQKKDKKNDPEKSKANYEGAINKKADNPGGTLTTSARVLFCDVVKQYIEEGLGGSDVKFTMNDKSQKSVDELNKDNVGNLYKFYKEKDGDILLTGGRNWRFTVSYIPEGGTEENRETKYFNYVYKSNKVDDNTGKSRGDELDIENGIFYLAEITKEDGENGKWVVVNDVKTPYDDYSLYANGGKIDAALKAVEDAEKKSEKLKDAVNAIRNKVLGVAPTAREEFDGTDDEYKEYIEGFNAECDSMLTNLKVATKYSRVKLNALRELIGERPEVTTGGGGETGGDGGETGGTTIPGPGGFTYTIPGGYTLPSGLLDGFGGTVTTGGGTTSGVLGVRTGGGTEADEGGAADSRTNVAPRADFGTVNKVLGSKQNKDNSQIVKKIKDNEIPLAEIPNMDDEVTMNWMWLLIIFLLGATGKKMYDEYKKKKEAEEAAKINK